ncbi:MAG: mechanosensitive ion channel [Betaproteobacteria bacterium]|nr:mechanosensitive ion channel [Betaproteobacteria bacterium]
MMHALDRICRAIAVGAMAAACAVAIAVPSVAWAQSNKAKATALPEPLTHESVRELVSRLSDEEVRKLLLDQLDRAAAPAKAKGDRAMSGMVEENAGMVRQRLGELRDAFVALPATLREVVAKLDEPEGPSVLPLVGALLAVALLVGWLAQRGYDFALRHYRERLDMPGAETFTARSFRLIVGLALDVGGIAVFALAFLALFLALWQGHALRRIAILEVLIAVVAVRMAWLIGQFLLSSRGEAQRLLPFADAPARQLRWFLVLLAALWGIGGFLSSVLVGGGASAATLDLLVVSISVLGLGIALWTVWRVRAPIAGLIRGDGPPNVVKGWLADLWPVIATLFFVAIVGARINDIFTRAPIVEGAGYLSVLLVMLIPLVDMVLCRAVAAAAAAPADARSAVPGFVASYESVFRRAIHIVVVVVGLFLLAQLWDINLFALAQASLGGKISSSLFGICIVLLLAYLLWEIAKTAIDRRLEAEGKQAQDVPASRLRTLLPLFRLLILITIVVMATMSLLAALGVDILPLLAGASVVGVAIGFGSQTLVRDIVSGAFFLMDDAFRLGEYIEVGSDKGTVEKINVRSVFLRHHRGALNILPYGEIKRLRNTSRDWRVVVMEFRLTYDTNIMQVKKILKKIGEELAADPDYKDDLIQPLKSQGVMAAEDSAIVVRAKFTAKPSSTSFMIRRVAYDKIITAFLNAGIKFAHKEVTVNVPSPHDDEETVKATAGAAARAAIEEPTTPPGGR